MDVYVNIYIYRNTHDICTYIYIHIYIHTYAGTTCTGCVVCLQKAWKGGREKKKTKLATAIMYRPLCIGCYISAIAYQPLIALYISAVIHRLLYIRVIYRPLEVSRYISAVICTCRLLCIGCYISATICPLSCTKALQNSNSTKSIGNQSD